MKKFMKNSKNKGFSLVELIIVIAIMAILMGVVGTQVLPYLEKSRQATDNQIISTVGTAAVSSFATQAGKMTVDKNYQITSTVSTPGAGGGAPGAGADTWATGTGFDTAGSPEILKDIEGFLGITIPASGAATSIASTIQGKMVSKLGKTLQGITIHYNGSSGVVTVTAYSDTACTTPILEQVVSK